MRCVILDDYQDVARTYAAWDSLDGVEVISLTEHLGPDALVRALDGAEIVVAMRERTPFPAPLLERPLGERASLMALMLINSTSTYSPSVSLARFTRPRNATVGNGGVNVQP